jgi:glycerol-3-phosphate dehydrogenase
MMKEKRGRQSMYDICIIGAGIIGSFLARDLSRYRLNVLLLEKDADVANGATMANSAIIHAGDDPEDGTLKARFNVRGALMYRDLCRELGVAFLETSALVAATSPEEEETLMMAITGLAAAIFPRISFPVPKRSKRSRTSRIL